MLIYKGRVVLIADGADDSQGERFTSLDGVRFEERTIVTLAFDPRRTVGWAVLYKDGINVRANFELLETIDDLTVAGSYPQLVPCVGGRIGKRLEARKFAVIDQIEVNEIGLCDSNADGRIPPLGEPTT
jgi:hypothetical protein